MIFYYLFAVQLLIRFFFLPHKKKNIVLKAILNIICRIIPFVVFRFDVNLVLYLLAMFSIDAVEYFILRDFNFEEEKEVEEKKEKKFLKIRYSTLFLSLITAIYFSYSLKLSVPFLLNDSTEHEIKKILIYLMFLLINLNEANLIIRGLITFLKLKPADKEKTSSITAGRLIGIFERIIIFLMAILNEIGAIGFIIAAKSIARYKKLEDQDFAEYMIIGTLISSSLALSLGLLAVYLINLK